MGGQQAGLSEAAILAGFAPPKWEPKPYQARGVDALCNVSCALFFKPGLGKTSTALAGFLKLQELGFAMRMLVVAPLKVAQTTWLEEPKKWSQFAGFKVGLAHGRHKKQVLEDLSNEIVVINYEGLLWLADYFKTNPNNFDVICYDELTKMKNHGSKRFKKFKKFMPNFKFRWGLTGTPMANGVLDLFGQIYCLDIGERLGKYVTHFRLRYAHQLPWDAYSWHVTEEKAQLIIDKISDISVFVSKEEWLDLPPIVTVPRPVPMPPELKPQYKFLEDEYILKLEDTVVTAANAGVLTSKLRQFTGGAVYGEDRKWSTIHDVKIEALRELIEELGDESLIVVYQFDHERERLQAAFPDAPAFKGGMSDAQTKQIKDGWNSGKYKVLLAQPASAGMGLNLQHGGRNICWFTPVYNLEHYEQMNDRLWRGGQKETVMVYLLTMEGTIDAHVTKVLTGKDVTQRALLETLKNSRLLKSSK